MIVDKKEYHKQWQRDNTDKTKEYNRRYREANKESIKQQQDLWREKNRDKESERLKASYARNKKNGTSIIGWITKKYQGVPCMDCNGVFPFCAMDFDHRPEEVKEFNVTDKGTLVINPERLAKVEKEISKCDIVCANCHRVRTQDRYK